MNEEKTARSVATGVGVVAGWIGVAHQLIPDQIEILTGVVLLLSLADMLTGLVVAAACGKVSSTQARLKAFAKFAQYLGLVCLGAGASLLTQQWGFYGAAWGCIAAIEALSVIENLVRLESVGVKLGPARPLLSKLARFFDAFPGAPPGPANPSPDPERRT